MNYCSVDDIAKARPAEFALMADPNNTGTPDLVYVQGIVDEVNSEIDAAVRRKYPLPLDTVPLFVKGIGVRLAVFRLSPEAGRLYSENKRKDYEDAKADLDRIAEGRLSLGAVTTPKSATGQPHLVKGTPRHFATDKTGGIL